ncbi:MAG TPA: PIN domain-containing protein [Streptosporangiaceae bacterium]
MIIADTSGLYTIFNRRQPEHQAARVAVERNGGPLVLSPLVLAELDYFILTRLGARAEQKVLAELRSPAYRLASFTDDDFKLASEVAGKYGDMQLGLTDASIMVQAARHKTTKILSLDQKHFGAVRPLTGDASFILLPRDDQA